MKILYGIQATGNGHLSRAMDVIPVLKQYGEVDILISGKCADISIPYPIRYKLNGLSFFFGKKGGIDFGATIRNMDWQLLWQEIKQLPVKNYDLVVNDFEPVSAWAARLKGVPCVSLSHQAAVAHKMSPKPRQRDWLGLAVLNYYAPANHSYGFHFAEYGGQIFTPVIRNQIRRQKVSNRGHYTVYLPAYDDETIIKKLSHFETVRWEVFSKHSSEAYRVNNVSVIPIDAGAFARSMASCEGVLCGAGFGTPSEALFLGKKLMVVPMKAQFEQQCNAESLKLMGVPVLKNLKKKRLHKIEAWLSSDQRVVVDYPDITAQIVRLIMEECFGHDPYRFLTLAGKGIRLPNAAGK